MFKAPAYVTISWMFLILIGIVFGYSYFFYPNAHPINCAIKERTGKNCAACGFSRAFSNYTHLQIKEGKEFNNRSWPVFLFFLFQFFLRFFIVSHYYLRKKMPGAAFLKADIAISISAFLLAFLPLLFKS